VSRKKANQTTTAIIGVFRKLPAEFFSIGGTADDKCEKAELSTSMVMCSTIRHDDK
jgi:hypothetical protein